MYRYTYLYGKLKQSNAHKYIDWIYLFLHSANIPWPSISSRDFGSDFTSLSAKKSHESISLC